MRKAFLFFSVLAIGITACKYNKTKLFPPVNLTCESDISPIGIDNPKPEFGWQLSDTSRGSKQVAYEIIVATSRIY